MTITTQQKVERVVNYKEYERIFYINPLVAQLRKIAEGLDKDYKLLLAKELRRIADELEKL